jgi:hypothetical protein
VCYRPAHLSRPVLWRPTLRADGKPPTPSWGTDKKLLTFGLRTLLYTFILATISKPILGIDFLAANRLLVDPPSRQVLDTDTLYPVSEPALPPAQSRLAAALCHVAPAIRSLIASFPAIIGDGSGTPNPKHGIKHSIETTCRPVFSKARRLDLDKLDKF